MTFCKAEEIRNVVKFWLLLGLIMIVVQIVIGGVTRLTGSGLSITRWEIVTGTIPPFGDDEWNAAFQLYQETPQYQKINRGMTLHEFKFIYFWEYFHRLWARLMFLVFVFPFGWFLWKGMLSRRLFFRLLVVVALAGLEGFFGWAMVASGLIKRPWVNAYNLTLHLSMALVIYSYLLWTIFIAFRSGPALSPKTPKRWHHTFTWGALLLLFFQLALGAMMSGTKAGLFYPTWPDMQGAYLPAVLLDDSHWIGANFINYDSNPFMPALLQFLHRNTAYLLTCLVLFFAWKTRKEQALRGSTRLLVIILGAQVLLGVLTVLNCVAQIPVVLGVLHQAGGVLLLSAMLYVVYLVDTRHFT